MCGVPRRLSTSSCTWACSAFFTAACEDWCVRLDCMTGCVPLPTSGANCCGAIAAAASGMCGWLGIGTCLVRPMFACEGVPMDDSILMGPGKRGLVSTGLVTEAATETVWSFSCCNCRLSSTACFCKFLTSRCNVSFSVSLEGSERYAGSGTAAGGGGCGGGGGAGGTGGAGGGIGCACSRSCS